MSTLRKYIIGRYGDCKVGHSKTLPATNTKKVISQYRLVSYGGNL